MQLISNNMARLSKAKQRWQGIEAGIQAYELNDLRQFFAAAAKFLIESKHWNDEHPSTRFDNSPTVGAFHDGFDQFSREKMLGIGNEHAESDEANLLDLLKQASEWNGKPLNRRVAGRKLTKLRHRLKKFFMRFMHVVRYEEGSSELIAVGNGNGSPSKGLRFYESVIRTKYLMKK